MRQFISRLRRTRIVIAPPNEEDGQGLVEYALILSLVALVCILILTVVGQTVSNTFAQINCELGGDGNGACTCTSEQVTITGSCLGTTFVGSINSDCTETTHLMINTFVAVAKGASFSMPNSYFCTPGYTTLDGYSIRSDGTYQAFSVTPS
jgi:pilus assembly protein Flp/PilA